MIPIYIVNFNTTEITNDCIKSIIDKLHAFEYSIMVFDNSNARRFKLDSEIPKNKITIIDNYFGKLINFNDVLMDSVNVQHYNKVKQMNISKFGTLKHTYTIDYIIKHEDKPFLLFDSDVKLLKDIDFIDDKYITIAGINHTEPKWPNRFFPYIQYFNVPMIKKYNICFFDKNRILFGASEKNNLRYDTGSSFYEDIMNANLPYKEIDYTEYINHLGNSSFTNDSQTISIGDFTYGNPRIIGDDSGAKLKIGNFCSIAEQTTIFLGLNHRYDWITTYPFSSNTIPTRSHGNISFSNAQHLEGHVATKGDVNIGNDVWIGFGTTIMSGVTIGDGAVIGAKTVVAKDVPPYSIAIGNPMKILRKRFSDTIIKQLIKCKWWNLQLDQINHLIPYMLSNNFDRFFSEYEKITKINQ